jgi:stalled ribosome rescue protein Dom34
MSEKKLAGIWMDSENATVVKNHDIESAFKFFLCDPVKRTVQGGNSSEKNANNAEQTNTAKFFKDLENLITNTEELYLTGTGQIQEQFKNHLAETAQFKNLKVTLDTDQKMSGEQFLEKVKSHFNA